MSQKCFVLRLYRAMVGKSDPRPGNLIQNRTGDGNYFLRSSSGLISSGFVSCKDATGSSRALDNRTIWASGVDGAPLFELARGSLSFRSSPVPAYTSLGRLSSHFGHPIPTPADNSGANPFSDFPPSPTSDLLT